jgi:hypothetical protein
MAEIGSEGAKSLIILHNLQFYKVLMVLARTAGLSTTIPPWNMSMKE